MGVGVGIELVIAILREENKALNIQVNGTYVPLVVLQQSHNRGCVGHVFCHGAEERRKSILIAKRLGPC